MFARIPSAALHGVDAYQVDVEVDVAGGLPAYRVVGLPATSVREGATRIRSALRNCGQDLPSQKITVNLAPADRRKDGAAFDLPIAVAVVVAAGIFRGDAIVGMSMVGELGLDGAVRPVRGVLAAAALARSLGRRGIIVPEACAAEAALVDGLTVYPVGHLAQVLRALDGSEPLLPWSDQGCAIGVAADHGDYADVRGQALARRAVEIAIAGGHSLLLVGPPGIGKSMLAQRMPSVLPPMSHDEAIEVTRIYSAAGHLPGSGLAQRRPFRAPHHTISPSALVGGGSVPRPGEITLAHRGVLFLDELAEFPRAAIDALRQPLEERTVRIARAGGNVEMPAGFHLVAAANPCPCGWFGSVERACICSLGALERYRARLSGPILDRIDLQVRVGAVSVDELRGAGDAEPSAAIRARVTAARERQAERLAPFNLRVNAELSPAATRATCRLPLAAERALQRLAARRALSARGIDRLVRTARTIADLDGRPDISADDIHEAAMFRALDVEPLIDRPVLTGAGHPPFAPLPAGPGQGPAM